MMVELTGADVLDSSGLFIKESLCIEDGIIRGIGTSARTRIDVSGCLILPGIIDLHGDGFEKIFSPRSNSLMPIEIAFAETDKQLVSNGITTAYYSPTITWEKDTFLRSLEGLDYILNGFSAVRDTLACDSKLHLRFEIHNTAAEEKVAGLLEEGMVDLLAFNDHLSYHEGKLQDPETRDLFTANSGYDLPALLAKFEEMKNNLETTKGAVERLAAICKSKNIPMASHDDDRLEVREWYHRLGCTICEFPTNDSTALHARKNGDAVVLGAPNAVRGKSLYGRMDARKNAAEGVCSIFASDYYYPSQLYAVTMMHELGILPLERGWDLVSANPAKALGLSDRGSIEPGKRADLVILRKTETGLSLAATIASGRFVYNTARQ